MERRLSLIRRSGPGTSRVPRRALLAAIVLLVIGGHAWVGRELVRLMESWHETVAPIEAVEVSIAGALQPAAPPLRALRTPPPVDSAGDAGSAQGATLPETAASDAVAAAEAASAAARAAAAAAAEAALDAAAAQASDAALATAAMAPSAAEAASAAAASLVDPWPPSTRIRYSLRGNFRGEFGGQAQVLWLRDGPRYRVELEVSIGPRAAPVVFRRVVSEGRLGASGLTPRRYEEDTRVLFSRARRVTMLFEPGEAGQAGTMRLQDGTRRPAPPGTQDSASQFVQLAWLFGTHPTPVKAGDRVSFPLALSRRSDQWTYVVGDPVTVETSAGPVETIHARPQRELDPLRRDLIAEVWFAPALQYLPVRMQVVVDAETFALMVMEGLPELVGPVKLGPGGEGRGEARGEGRGEGRGDSR